MLLPFPARAAEIAFVFERPNGASANNNKVLALAVIDNLLGHFLSLPLGACVRSPESNRSEDRQRV